MEIHRKSFEINSVNPSIQIKKFFVGNLITQLGKKGKIKKIITLDSATHGRKQCPQAANHIVTVSELTTRVALLFAFISQ